MINKQSIWFVTLFSLILVLSIYYVTLNDSSLKSILDTTTSQNDSSLSVSKEESIDKEEVKCLIVARVKETFGFRKAPTVDFIRLVNSFLLKQEDNNEEINI